MGETVVPAGRVRSERNGHILKIVIDNPGKMNAFSPEMMEELSAHGLSGQVRTRPEHGA